MSGGGKFEKEERKQKCERKRRTKDKGNWKLEGYINFKEYKKAKKIASRSKFRYIFNIMERGKILLGGGRGLWFPD